jgi:hypothetical protein
VGRTASRPVGNPASRRIVQAEARDALPPTALAVGFRAVPL